MRSKRSVPWIHRKSRFIIASVATFGAIITAYLTVVKLSGGPTSCPTQGCSEVLSSPYATVFGLPLALFGFLAYTSMGGMAVAPWLVDPESQKGLRSKLEHGTWQLMFACGTSMMIFSGYLMYLMMFEIKSFCLFCVASALCSLALFVLTLIGRDWEDIGQLMFIGIIVAMITIVGSLGVYASVHSPRTVPGGYEITTPSSPAEIELAKHLTQIGAKMYGSYKCPHCHNQKELFGKEAVNELTYIECDPNGKNPQPDLCQAAQIKGYPTWEIQGKFYPGEKSLADLAELSGYQGSRNFQNR